MKIIYNSFIPFEGYSYINLFGILFAKNKYKNIPISKKTLNHESIHTKQIQEMGYIFFYIWYFVEWIIKCIFSLFKKSPRGVQNWPYKSISFEQEAYYNENDFDYLINRKHYCWLKNLFKMYKV